MSLFLKHKRACRTNSALNGHNLTRGAKILFYQLDLNDEIVFDPVLFLNTNIGDSRRRGLIFEGYYSPVEKLKFTANYGYIDAEIVSGNFAGSDITFIADHTARLTTQYKYNDNLSGYLEFTGLSERKFEGDFANAFSSLPGYIVSNMNLAYQHKNFIASFRINNLFDKKYSDAGQIGFDFRQPFPAPRVETFFPAPERNYFFSLSYNYD